MKVLLATTNKHKITEIRQAVERFEIELLSLSDFPDIPEVVEDGKTLEENSLKKAKEIYELTQILTIADDTGLEVDALNGAPGVYSARYAGEQCIYAENNKKLLKELVDVPIEKRTACFRCVITIFGENVFEQVEGRLCGKIIFENQGTNGFGYDPIFVPDGFSKTLAELTLEEKNQISHRGLAVRKMAEKMSEMMVR